MNIEDNKKIMAENIKYYMEQKGVTNQQLCDDLNFKYTTFMDWLKGVTYPRIGKIEAMADYFGVLKSDLIEKKHQQPTQSKLSARKKAFMQKVEGMSDDQLERLERILALVENKEV